MEVINECHADGSTPGPPELPEFEAA